MAGELRWPMSYNHHCGRFNFLFFSLVKDAGRRKVDVRYALTRREKVKESWKREGRRKCEIEF